MLKTYTSEDTSKCFRSRQVVFIGDSITRQLFFQFANIVDPKLPDAPPDDDHKHSNYTLDPENGVKLSFFWDPYLNSSYSQLIHPTGADRAPSLDSDRPALLVLGTGLWYLRYKDSGGLPAWEARIEAVIETIKNAKPPLADKLVILPVEEPVISKLSPERASTIRESDVDAMNSDLFHRIYPPHDLFSTTSPSSPDRMSLPLVLNQMLDDSQTTDGLHFSTPIVKAQANLLLNFRCNDALSKKYPMDKTCCRNYPSPSLLHLFVILIACLAGPVYWYHSYHTGLSLPHFSDSHIYFISVGQINPVTWISDEHRPVFIMSGAVALMYVADRTGFWFKEQKQFDPWLFGSSCVLALLVGLATVKRADKDLGFLNRDQTDEWKGWMQSRSLRISFDDPRPDVFWLAVVILIYHYTGASKISGIYNPIRVLVAAYLFMTGYGHTVFYLKKADFGFLRVAQVMVSLPHSLHHTYPGLGYGQVELAHHHTGLRDEHRLPLLLLCPASIILVYRCLCHHGYWLSVQRPYCFPLIQSARRHEHHDFVHQRRVDFEGDILHPGGYVQCPLVSEGIFVSTSTRLLDNLLWDVHRHCVYEGSG